MVGKSKFKLRFAHKGMILVAVPLVFELGFVFVLSHMVDESHEISRRARRSQMIQMELGNMGSHVVQGYTELIKYRIMPNNQRSLVRYQDTMRSMDKAVERLKILTADNPEEQEHVLVLHSECRLIEKSIEHLMPLSVGSIEAIAQMQDIEGHVKNFKAQSAQLQALEGPISAASEELEERSHEEIQNLIKIIVAFNVIFTIAIVMFFSRGVTRRLNVLMENAQRLADDKELKTAVGGTDELADLERIFHDMARSLKDAQQRKQEFFQMASHDLRSPLLALRVVVELVRKGKYGSLNEQGVERIKQADATLENLICSINNLLDVERMQAGHMQLIMEECPLQPLIEKAIATVDGSAQQKHVSLTSEKTELIAKANEERLLQVLINLLSNAIKYSPEGKTITVTALACGNEVEVRIADEGAGIAQEKQKVIFERFAQVGTEIDRANASTGLGLAICKAIVEAHGGAIGVHSENGAGTTFWFRVPAILPQVIDTTK